MSYIIICGMTYMATAVITIIITADEHLFGAEGDNNNNT